MATKIDQKEYLKRYLSNDKDKKKKKKKKDKKAGKPGNVVIVDDDLDLTELQRRMDADETDLFGLDEEAPLVVGIIDERPPELRAKEDFSTTKWKAVATTDSFDSMLQQTSRADKSHTKRKSVSPPSRSVSRRQRKDSDESPPRRRSKEREKGKSRRADSDESPPRKLSVSKSNRHKHDSDESPPRKRRSKERQARREDSDTSPPRKRGQRDDSDTSPPRKQRPNDSDESPPRRKEDKAPERRKHRRVSDESPPRRHRQKEHSGRTERSDGKRDQPSTSKSRHRANGSDESPPRRKESSNRRRNSDESPPRRNRPNESEGRSRRDAERRDHSRKSPTNGRRRNDSDESPPRRRGHDARESSSHRNSGGRPQSKPSRTTSPPVRIKLERHTSDSDLSPPRKSGKPTRKDSDESPPRRKASQRRFSRSPERHIKRESSQRKDYREMEQRIKQEPRSPSPRRNESTNRMTKTLDGKRAGLQDAASLREENEKHRARERAALMQMSDDVSGRYADTVVRDKSGRRRDVEKELREELTKRKHEEEKKKIYTRWGKGVKQEEDYNAKLQEAAREMEKPLARYADDKDLDEYLKQQERDGDPMLEYLRNKQKEENRRAGIPEKPIYQGTFPDNRFGLRPGYRWDGVDRSNGFEKRWFESTSKKKAVEEEAYKYSVEDM
ncbi:BUD13 homolog [Anopheles marshallii]|uniref:BUD13 homolog n=1 Tax=Anopheles marshallii TaxID=1521116 RepID=UPI00237AC590|nr:BUD13 homolog [Anopheles marshallii]